MARPRARKTIKNPSRKTVRKNANPNKVPHIMNDLIRKHWDKKLTLKQNYEKLGLIANLNGQAGGTEHGNEERMEAERKLREQVEWRTIDAPTPSSGDSSNDDELPENYDVEVNGPIEVDARITAIGTNPSSRRLPLFKPQPSTSIVGIMEEQAKNIAKVERHASEQESKVFGDLMRKYGLDYAKMARDIKLNRYQLSEGQLRKKIEKLINKD
ncbi:ribosome biogenesis protein Nop16 [Gaertneriomyces semiglobifer]|nr:ribosome biogenesis protein Nop16 [Gaertneriomyces semiglobifer]